MTFPEFGDGIPLRGVGPEHIRDKSLTGQQMTNGFITAALLNSGLLGLVGDVTAIDPDDAAAAGATGRLADAGHQHAFTASAPIEISGDTNNEGTSPNHARADHDHAFPATTGAEVLTSETTTSVTYADLATVGPTVTMTPPASGKVLVHIFGNLSNSGAQASIIGLDVSIGNTIAPTDDIAIATANTSIEQFGGTFLLTGLAVSSTQFRLKYKVGGGTGTFLRRKIIVQPLPS